ncbi:MAG: tetratricopeptide repeat protein [Bacteroidetes bacterium]|nr:tetratricopeptide repeat protein [Bacteroidota bacterium]
MSLSEKIGYKKGQNICLDALGQSYAQMGKYDTAMICFEKCYEIIKDLKDSIDIATTFNNMGVIYYNCRDYKKALALFEKADRIYESRNEKGSLINGYNNIGNIYLSQAEYPVALEYYLKVCRICEEEKNEKDIVCTLINIGYIYVQLKQYDKAKQCVLDAKVKAAKANNLLDVGNALHALSSIYANERDFKNTIKYLKEAKAIFDEMQSQYDQITVIQNLGSIYNQLGENEKALKYFNSALPIAQKIGDNQLISALYGNIGAAYSDKGDFRKAKEYMLKSEKLFKEINDKLSLLGISENIIVLYARINQPDSVKKYLDKYKQLQDTIYNEKNSKAVAEMQTKYETEKKDKEILALSLEAEKKKNTIWAIAAGSSLLLVVLLSGFVVFRNKKKREQAVLSLMASESDMKALRAQLNPHFMFNCIHTINGLLNELKIQESRTCLDKFSNLTRSVLENSKKREIPLSDELETLRLYMDLENMRFIRPFQYEFIIEPGIVPETTLVPPLILQPFVENSIKHGFRDPEKPGQLKIEIRTENESLVCSVEDNGVGRNTVNIKTGSGFKKESLGIKLTEERLDLISKTKKTQSHFSIKDLVDGNNKPDGTRVEMYLPYELSV